MIVNFDKYIDNRNANLSKFDGLRVCIMRAKIIAYLCGLQIWILILLRLLFSTSKGSITRVFGYYGSNKSFINSVKMWMKSRHDWDISEEWCSVVHGVNTGLEWACERSGAGMRFTFFPIYYSFFNTIKNNGRVPKEIPLKKDKNQYEVDFND